MRLLQLRVCEPSDSLFLGCPLDQEGRFLLLVLDLSEIEGTVPFG